jgi:hypothetical protein
MHTLVNIPDEGIARLNTLAAKGEHLHAPDISKSVTEHLRKDANNDRIERGIEIPAGEPSERRHHVQELIAPFEIVELDVRIADAAVEIGRTR